MTGTDDALRLEANPAYSTPCTTADLTAALGKRRAKQVQEHYDQPMTMADLLAEKAIDEGGLTLLDGAWGTKQITIPMAANLGLRLTDTVVANGVARGLCDENEAVYVTIGHPFETWAHLCTGDMFREHHKNRVFVLSEHPELFNLSTLWEVGYAHGDLNLGTSPEALHMRETAEIAARQIAAPFTPEQVTALQSWQQHDEPVRCKQVTCVAAGAPALDVRTDGLVCPACGTTRAWAWRSMLEVA